MQLDDQLRAAIRQQLTCRRDRKGKRRSRNCDAWRTGIGFKSDALGVGVEQIPQARDELAKRGVSCDFDPRTGAAILTSSRHYRKVAQASGLWEGAHGYGVPNPIGGNVGTGRGQEIGKAEFRKKVREELADIP